MGLFTVVLISGFLMLGHSTLAQEGRYCAPEQGQRQREAPRCRSRGFAKARAQSGSAQFEYECSRTSQPDSRQLSNTGLTARKYKACRLGIAVSSYQVTERYLGFGYSKGSICGSSQSEKVVRPFAFWW
jgi:hypothetical protein